MIEDREQVGWAIGRIPSGLAILTAAHDGRSTGMLVSWFQQCSFEPLMLTVAIRRRRPVQVLMEASGAFVLNLLSAEGAPSMLKHFAKGFSLEEDAFRGIRVASTDHGPVILAALASLGCAIRTRLAAGDHDLYAAEVVAAGLPGGRRADLPAADTGLSAPSTDDASDQRPTTPYVHVRKTGLSY